MPSRGGFGNWLIPAFFESRMIALHVPSVCEPLILAIASAGRFTSRFLVLSVALLCYGSVPSTATIQSEYESQLQEEAAASAGCQFDLRNKLRGSAHRRAGATVLASSGQFACQSILAATGANDRAPRLSAGLAVPLRC
jgi:hypothetical protein